MNTINRFTLDLEFAEKPGTIEVISIALVCDDGSEYYAENSEFSGECNEWVRANVLPKLVGGRALRTRAQIADDIREFVGDGPRFYGYYADYDWVALCWLYGTMMDLPKGWPMYCRDLQQSFVDVGEPENVKPAQPDDEHSALSDARWNMTFLRELDKLGC